MTESLLRDSGGATSESRDALELPCVVTTQVKQERLAVAWVGNHVFGVRGEYQFVAKYA
jgi:hypothetical protein